MNDASPMSFETFFETTEGNLQRGDIVLICQKDSCQRSMTRLIAPP